MSNPPYFSVQSLVMHCGPYEVDKDDLPSFIENLIGVRVDSTGIPVGDGPDQKFLFVLRDVKEFKGEGNDGRVIKLEALAGELKEPPPPPSEPWGYQFTP